MPNHKAATPVAHFESLAEGRGWNASFREPAKLAMDRALLESAGGLP